MGKISCTSVKSLHYYNYANTVLNVQLKKKKIIVLSSVTISNISQT